ncbi:MULTISPECIES: HIT family protein [unclassified Agarivorans]|uniref:HIT family protein n=1 Tax=unclassified Agarivorans TaxID=2636026 RepID=UPI0026E14028|nr:MULTISPECIES: HIT family protein [unclassified Agarivorans]MDO6684777.1 HIT family protein [Agarivorans sp. 3_MG-2023]MDO6715062.1 HIT family protein [Agarivorans sp. 2_MG-2023]
MSYDNNNIFAKIIRGEMGCLKVYEDDYTLAFMDIMPQADGHTLVLPKESAETLFELSEEGAAAVIKTVKKVAAAVKQAMNAEGISLVQFNGAAAGQTVPHLHFHIIPGSLAEARSHARDMVDSETLQPFADKIAALLAK